MQLFNTFYRQWQGGLLLALLQVSPFLYANPVANFVITPSTGCVPIRIFLDASSSQPSVGAQMTSYQWQSSGGQGILPREVSSVYLTNAGTYTFTLTVTDSTGLTTSTQKSVTLTPTGSSNCNEDLPVAQFTATPISGSLQVILDANASTGSITDYLWRSNDGQYIAPDQMTTVTYPQAGTYTITLTVENLSGATDSMSKTVTVGNPTSFPSQATFSSGTLLLQIPEVIVNGTVSYAIEMRMTGSSPLTFELTKATEN